MSNLNLAGVCVNVAAAVICIPLHPIRASFHAAVAVFCFYIGLREELRA